MLKNLLLTYFRPTLRISRKPTFDLFFAYFDFFGVLGLLEGMPPRKTNFYTPQVREGAPRFDNSTPAVYKMQGPEGTGFLYTAGAELSKRATPPSTGGVYIFFCSLKISLPA